MVRNTKQREKILEQLETTTHPQSAEMIFKSLRERINLATIYRSLNTFLEKGLVSKSVINQTSYYTLAKNGHHHYLICLTCNKMEEVECDLTEIKKPTTTHKFQIAYHDMTYFGYCEECVSKENKD